MKILTQKIVLFGFWRWRGKENGVWKLGLMGFAPKQYNPQRELTLKIPSVT
jgi:hypothetical protein